MQAQLSLCLCGVPKNLNLNGIDMGIAHNPGLAFYNSLAEQPGDSTVDRESTDAVSGGKPSVAQTL